MKHNIVESSGYPVNIGNEAFYSLQSFIVRNELEKDKLFILCDEGSEKYCLPVLLSNVALLQDVPVIVIPRGEENKNIETSKQLWLQLSEKGADRNSVLINLGGGVVSDLGGFVASTFKRGIRYINIPTTLLSMVDAAIGGKVGVDLNNFKNQVGLFANPVGVFIIPGFLDTLPDRHIRSGYAEIIKHALIYSKNHWFELAGQCFDDINGWKKIIEWSVNVKNYYVTKDPLDNGLRKALNFGHTIGHAFETYSLSADDNPLLHGEAVAVGMICESYISYKVAGLKKTELYQIVDYILKCFPYYSFDPENIDLLLDILKHDKKKIGNQMNMTLLSSIGSGVINRQCGVETIKESINFYLSLNK